MNFLNAYNTIKENPDGLAMGHASENTSGKTLVMICPLNDELRQVEKSAYCNQLSFYRVCNRFSLTGALLDSSDWFIEDLSKYYVEFGENCMDLLTLFLSYYDQNQYHDDYSKALGLKIIATEINDELKIAGIPWRVGNDQPYAIFNYTGDFPYGDWDNWDSLAYATGIFMKHINAKLARFKEAQRRQMFDKLMPKKKILGVQLSFEEFRSRILASQSLYLVHLPVNQNTSYFIKPVAMASSSYGGARTDRLAARNKLTTALGFPGPLNSRAWFMDDKDHSGGIFLADILRNYGSEFLIIDGSELLDTVHDHSFCWNDGLGYGDIEPKQYWLELMPILEAINQLINDYDNFNPYLMRPWDEGYNQYAVDVKLV